MIVYMLFHLRVVEDDIIDRKLIGIFSSYDNVLDAIKRYSEIVGFADFPDGFKIEPYHIAGKTYSRIRKSRDVVFFLQYEYSEELIDYVVDLGLYSTRLRAMVEAIKFGLSLLVHKREDKVRFGGRFYNVAYKINEEHWKEGFFNYKDMA